jgi:large conductance mechanosensitive channel
MLLLLISPVRNRLNSVRIQPPASKHDINYPDFSGRSSFRGFFEAGSRVFLQRFGELRTRFYPRVSKTRVSFRAQAVAGATAYPRAVFILKKTACSQCYDFPHGEASMLKGFRQFIMRGNVIDLAVAVVIGAAFGAVVTSFVTNILTPFIAAIAGKPDFSAFNFTVNGAVIAYGLFLNALISFLLIALAIYFFMIAPMNAWKARAARNAVPADPTSKKCPECLSEVPIAARRCAFCTSIIATQTQFTPGNA